jgi:hypothetical protein
MNARLLNTKPLAAVWVRPMDRDWYAWGQRGRRQVCFNFSTMAAALRCFARLRRAGYAARYGCLGL